MKTNNFRWNRRLVVLWDDPDFPVEYQESRTYEIHIQTGDSCCIRRRHSLIVRPQNRHICLARELAEDTEDDIADDTPVLLNRIIEGVHYPVAEFLWKEIKP